MNTHTILLRAVYAGHTYIFTAPAGRQRELLDAIYACNDVPYRVRWTLAKKLLYTAYYNPWSDEKA